MSMLDRYRKSGGFVQLLTLLETCGPTKKENFLKIISGESQRWADTLRSKMLDVNRIYSWNDETFLEILGTLQDLTIAIALIAGDDALRTRVLALLPHGRRRKIEELMSINKPTPGEIATMHMKMIETVRKMANDGSLRFDKFDQALAIEDDIEVKLNKAAMDDVTVITSSSAFSIEYENGEGTNTAITTPDLGSGSTGMSDEAKMEISGLRKKLADAAKENAILRHELNVAKTKLEQIKKIA